MTFRWTREAGTLTSTCAQCHLVITGRRDTDVTREQRSHTLLTCAQRRFELERIVTPPTENDYVLAARKHAEYVARIARKQASADTAETCCASKESGGAQGSIDLAKTNRPARKRRTVLSTPSATHGKEAVDS